LEFPWNFFTKKEKRERERERESESERESWNGRWEVERMQLYVCTLFISYNDNSLSHAEGDICIYLCRYMYVYTHISLWTLNSAYM
jgi:hypothetical protein